MANRIRLGELLVRAGVIDEMQLKAALAEQHRWGGRLGRVLVDMAFVSEDILVKALSKQLGVERADLQTIDVPPQILELVPIDFAQSNSICPVRYDDRRRVLLVATADPTNVAALDELRFKTGVRIETALAGEHEIHMAIQRHLRGGHGIDFDMPDAIELSDDDGSSVIVPNSDYAAAMAASGVPVLSGRPGAGVATPQNPPPPSARPASAPPQASLHALPRQSTSPPPSPFAPSTPSGPASPAFASPAPPLGGSLSPAVSPVAAGQPIPGASFSPPPGPAPTPPQPSSPPAYPVPGAAPAGPAGAPVGGSALEMATRLEGAQKQQQRALRVMVELLIEKGVISRDEYLARTTPKP